MKNKTWAVWLTFLLGPLGLHRLYIKGRMDIVGYLLPIPTLLGLYGVYRARNAGLDDTLSWLLIPLLGFTLAGCALNAIWRSMHRRDRPVGSQWPAWPQRY